MRGLLCRASLRAILLLGFLASPAQSQHNHGGDERATTPAVPPRIFLDKSPRVVAYQLKRLNIERLLLVERQTDDTKYAPVYKAILLRAGMSPQYREEALRGLVSINKSNSTIEILSAIESLDYEDRQQNRSARELAAMLLGGDVAALMKSTAAFEAAAHSDNKLVRGLGYAGLITTLQSRRALSVATDHDAITDLLSAVSFVPQESARNAMRDRAIEFLDSPAIDIRKAAIRTLGQTTNKQAETFRELAPFVARDRLRTPAVRALLKISAENRDAITSANVVDTLVRLAEQTPAARRTTNEFTDAMQLADQLLALLPVESSRAYRDRLREVTVRVIQIHTVDEEMRYDTPYFAAEAGRPVQVVLKNDDLMPHNLVITTPGSLQEVAELGLRVGPNGGHEGRQYVPDSDMVLFATNMVPPGKSERLTFTAPTEPAEYSYVCTFPRHWMRMYGVMLVVDDLDAWLQNPIAPKDPLGSTRSFVNNWTVDDFDSDLAGGAETQSLEVGKQLFTEATCAQCHKANGEGGAVGPDLNGVLARSKGERKALLREILDPSHRIDPKYAVHLIITDEGATISGIVSSEDKQTVSLLVNPESTDLTLIQRDSIEEIVRTSTSMMPKGLLDRFAKDEILQLLAYLESLEAAE